MVLQFLFAGLYGNLEEGRTFVFAFPEAYTSKYHPVLTVTSFEEANVCTKAPAINLNQCHNVAANSQINIKFVRTIRTSSGKENKGVLVASDVDIRVQVANYGQTHSGD